MFNSSFVFAFLIYLVFRIPPTLYVADISYSIYIFCTDSLPYDVAITVYSFIQIPLYIVCLSFAFVFNYIEIK